MTVGELIAKLSQLPTSTAVAVDGETGYDADLSVFQFQARVERGNGWTFVYDDNDRDDVETVVLISHFGQGDDKEEL